METNLTMQVSNTSIKLMLIEPKKVYLSIFNRYDELVERKIYWSFDYLEERLTTKVKFLAIVNAWPTKINNWNYFNIIEWICIC